MKFSPEEYGAYWSGALRMAAGLLVMVFAYRGTTALTGHPAWGARILGWVLVSLAVVVGVFAVALGLARVIRTAVSVERRRG